MVLKCTGRSWVTKEAPKQTFFATKWFMVMLTVLKIEVGCEVGKLVLRGVGGGKNKER